MSNDLKAIVLLGAPGAGKGTVAQHLLDNFDVIHFSTGNLLRNEVKNDTEVGAIVKSILGSGDLVSDGVVNQVVEVNLERVLPEKRVVLLDGFPRSVDQAKFLDTIFDACLKNSMKVIEIEVDYELIVARIVGRRVCVLCAATFGADDKIGRCSRCGGELVRRGDDEEEVVRHRLLEYQRITLPVSAYYADRLIKVDGNASREIVLQSVTKLAMELGL
ncbi:MAG: nucleoside monophosphate kinase [Holosporaceae bacterium]|jgi:adenylate kinase|nr:nucleoside monophosphate kinase [Holosporaceae bacterium]